MKTKVLIIRKQKIFIWIMVLVLMIMFVYAFLKINVNTMNIYDPIYKGNEKEAKVAFACNVVWGNEFLPDILKTLKENNIKITFFIGGDWAERYPEQLLSIYKDGHELGNHGYKHKKQSQLSMEQNKLEILKTEDVVYKLTGCKTTLFAPPYGDINDTVVKTAEGLGYKVIMWSVDTIDWNTKDYNKVLERVSKKRHNGAIVLMHPTEVTVKALPSMIKELQANNFTVVNVSEVLN